MNETKLQITRISVKQNLHVVDLLDQSEQNGYTYDQNVHLRR